MKTLFISDLDGTLLDPEGRVSPTTARILNDLLADGLPFTVASGRTPLSALPLLSDLKLTLPLILLNGAVTMDPAGRVLRSCPFTREEADRVTRLEDDFGLASLQLGVQGKACLFSVPEGDIWPAFFAQYEKSPLQPLPAGRVSQSEAQLLYLVYLDHGPEKLRALRDALEATGLFTLDFYKDCYSDTIWGLEVYPRRVSKGEALNALLRTEGFGTCAAFGDSLNDLSLFALSGYSLAVRNAKPALAKEADEIIPSNRENGVACWLRDHWKEDLL